MNTRKLSAFAGKYKYVLIILLAGLILLLLPGGSRTKAEPTAAQPIDTQMQTIQTEEQRLAQLLRILAHGDGVLVHDAIDAVVIVLHVYPLTQRTHIVANGQFT